MVISDTASSNTFPPGIDLNRWLEENDYLKVDDNRRQDEHLAGVDWVADAGVRHRPDGHFINIKGILPRYSHRAAKRNSSARKSPSAWRRSWTGTASRPSSASISGKAYRGPYKDHAQT